MTMRSQEEDDRQATPKDTYRRHSNAMRLAAIVVLLCMLTQLLMSGDLHSILAGTSNTILKSSNFTTNSTSTDDNQFDPHHFETILWPHLQRELCPGGTPRLPLGAKLFELARSEFGSSLEHKKSKKSHYKKFFDSTDGSTLILDNKNPKASLLYIRIWKCANNQIRDYLEKFFNQQPTQKSKLETIREKVAAKKLRINGEAPLTKTHKTNVPPNKETNSSKANGMWNYTYVELEPREFYGLFNPSPYKKKTTRKTNTTSGNPDKPFFRYGGVSHEKPCVFTVLRDPIGHFLSGYNEIEFRIIGGKVKLNEKLKTFGKPKYMDISHTSEDLRVRRFETFVRNLIEEHALFYDHWVYSHVFPLARMLNPIKKLNLLPTLEESPQQWILPSIANLSQSLPSFLATRCPNFVQNYAHNSTSNSSSLPPLKISKNGVHASSKDRFGTYQAAKDVWEQKGHVARSLCHLHAFDYGCFYGNAVPSGTSLGANDIPRICREVYAGDLFRETVHSLLK